MALPRDVRAVFAAKTARTFGYGFLGVLLPVYLTDLGLGATAIGAVVTLLLAGSAALTWAVRRPAELWGSRTTLLGLAVLSVLAAGLLVATHEPWLVVLAALLANVAVGTGETGPFLTLDQVLVARAVPAARRTTILSWYNLLGYGAAAVGAATIRVVPAPRALFAVFLLVAVVQCAAYAALGRGLAPARRPPGAPRPSAPLIRRLAALFALDSFAGGFVLQALVAYFLHARYGLGLEALGGVFFVVQLLTAVSLLLAARAARRFGLLPTMVVSHLVSNAVLVAIAFAPTAAVAVGLLFVRHLLSQMDVPTRQAYVMAVVEDHEREAAATATNLARTAAQAVTPALTGWVMQAVALSAPFALGGGLKIVYDLLLYWTFKDVKLKRDA
ncbi:MAG: MFS transporter [Candidatus Rokubacteria bacterium]|nr:MFS transporter [Candidatus Rokubacteria bacterium]